jgi:hypothetical protein
MMNTRSTIFTVEWANELTMDEIPLMVLNAEEGDNVIELITNIVGAGVEHIDALIVTEMGASRSYVLKPKGPGWKLVKVVEGGGSTD